jgi:hypothetical protein
VNRAWDYSAYLVAAVLAAFGVLGGSVVCLVLAGLVAGVKLVGEALVVAMAMRNAGGYGREIAAALVAGGFVTWPTRVLLRWLVKPAP